MAFKFATEGGSTYSKLDSGIWVRRKPSGETRFRHYIGSVDASRNSAFVTDSKFSGGRILEQLIHGEIEGFTPEFVPGYRPIGIEGPELDSFSITETGLRFDSDNPRISAYHIGSRIKPSRDS